MKINSLFCPKLNWVAVLCLVYTLPCRPPTLPDRAFLDTATASRHFIAATGDMVGASDEFFWGEGMAGEIKQRYNDWGKLLKFEGRHFRSINVKHPGLRSDTIKRLSPHPVCLYLTHISFSPEVSVNAVALYFFSSLTDLIATTPWLHHLFKLSF